jgi:hypothetical protein
MQQTFAIIAAVNAKSCARYAIWPSAVEPNMPDFLNTMLKLLQGSALGDVVRNGEYLYPVLESSNILGIALLIGPAFMFDLRLLGHGRRVMSVTSAARILLPVSHIGFAIAAVTGIALLSSQANVVPVPVPRRGSLACCSRVPQRAGVSLRWQLPTY